MSQENVELHYRAIDAFNRRHLGAFLALMGEDMEANPLFASMEGRYHGHDGIRRMWEDLLNAVPDLTTEAVEVRDLGDVTVAALRPQGHGGGSDAPLEGKFWAAVRWRRGKCVWWCDFYTEQEALEAVGLSEQDAQADS
jgi:hypothetical protein